MANFAYLVGSASGNEVAVIDPAWDAAAILGAAKQHEKRIVAVILSHSHFDHMNALADVLASEDVPVYAQVDEVAFSNALDKLGDRVRPVDMGQTVAVGTLPVTLLHTPGHTPGSQCALAQGALFTGDTVFVNACGRCDLEGGSPEDLYRSIREVLMKLPAETQLYPGHHYGDVPVSTLDREQKQNPYFRTAARQDFITRRMG